jgi:hypothetical protein
LDFTTLRLDPTDEIKDPDDWRWYPGVWAFLWGTST